MKMIYHRRLIISFKLVTEDDGISLYKHTTQIFVSWTSEIHVIKWISSFFARNMSELWSTQLPTHCHFDFVFIPSQITSQCSHFWFSEILTMKFGFLDQFCWRKTTPSKIKILSRPNYISPRVNYRSNTISYLRTSCTLLTKEFNTVCSNDPILKSALQLTIYN